MEVSQPLDHVTHAVIGGSSAINFGISDSAEFFDILSRTLYTDQILAVVREVLCNAWDAHIAAGCTDTPIQITLDGEYFIVRDYGYGIPHKDIGPIYGVYGASTKKNDGSQTGGFGLGCKAPFAYTEHFEVTSSNQGTRTIYNMSKSNSLEKGKPGIFTITYFPTTETGLRVKIPVLTRDFARFKELIHRIVSNGEMSATLNADRLPIMPFSKTEHSFLMTTKNVIGTNRTSIGTRYDKVKRILVRYGSVIYPVERSAEIGTRYDEVMSTVSNFKNYNLILQAPPSSMSVTPSREALSMQEHTVNTLNTLFWNFSQFMKGLNQEIVVQSRKRMDVQIERKSYTNLFSLDWGFIQPNIDSQVGITNLTMMACFQLTKGYPNSVSFRVRDVTYRVEQAVKAKLIDSKLAASFLKLLPEIKKLPSIHYGTGRSDWLHRHILSKVMVKLEKANMTVDTLFLLDRMQPKPSSFTGILFPVRKAYSRNHLINLPFLRKVVVITTATTDLETRIRSYAHHNPSSPRDGMLCYYIRSRKKENIEKTIEVFTKLGYEIIDLTKRYKWDKITKTVEYKEAGTKKKEPYAGLPCVSNILTGVNTVDIPQYQRTNAIMLPAPELVILFSSNIKTNQFDGFTTSTLNVIARLYENRLGIADNKNAYNKAIKNGAAPFIPVLEKELQDTLLLSPTVAEYFAYEFDRVRAKLNKYNSNVIASETYLALKLIYKDPGLRKEFGIKNEITDKEKDMLTIFSNSEVLTAGCKDPIMHWKQSIPLAKENDDAIKAVTNNDLLNLLDINGINKGLLSPKRQICYDIFLKILKG